MNNKILKLITRILCLLLVVIMILPYLIGCRSLQSQQEPTSRINSTVDTVVKVSLYDSQDEGILDECFRLCDEYELVFSRINENSELYKLNNDEINPDEISEELFEVISSAYNYSSITDGSFDFTLTPLSNLWDFKSNTGTIPEQSAIDEALSKVGYENITITENTLTMLDSDIQIDLGAIAKGYMADKIKAYLYSEGIESALIDLGQSTIVPIGTKPNGNKFKIGIKKPFTDELIGTIQLTDMAISTTGTYERFFEVDGEIYHHILDPKTGYPVQNELSSVLVITKNAMDADALSTALFTLGLDEGLKLANSLEATHVLFLTTENEIVLTDEFEENIILEIY